MQEVSISDVKSKKPQRSYIDVVKSLYQVLRIETSLNEPFWCDGDPQLMTLKGGRLRLGVWNIFKGNGGLHFMRDYQRFVSELDLVLIQEALLSQHSLQTFRHDGFGLIHCGSYERMDGLRDGVMNLCRLPHTGQLHRLRSVYTEPIFGTPKVAMVAQYQLTTKTTLLVANVHSILIRSVSRALEELQPLIDLISQHEGPLIVAGDFNTFQGNYFHQLEKVLARSGLRNVLVPRDPRKSLSQKLDHIFVRGLVVEKARVDDRFVSSDHYPLIAHFAVA